MYRCVASSWQAMTSRDTSLIAAPAGAVAVNNIARAIKRAATEGIQVESLDYAIPAELDHCCFKKSVIRVETGQFLSFPLTGWRLRGIFGPKVAPNVVCAKIALARHTNHLAPFEMLRKYQHFSVINL